MSPIPLGGKFTTRSADGSREPYGSPGVRAGVWDADSGLGHVHGGFKLYPRAVAVVLKGTAEVLAILSRGRSSTAPAFVFDGSASLGNGAGGGGAGGADDGSAGGSVSVASYNHLLNPFVLALQPGGPQPTLR